MTAAARATTDKSTQKLTIFSAKTLTEAIERVTAMWYVHKYLVVSIRPGRDRSLDQNRLWRKMYERVSQAEIIGSPDEVWHYAKLMLGVPILCRDDEGFERMWNKFFAHLDYEQQLYLMGPSPLFGPEGFRVTSLFGTKQGCEYTDRIADHFAMHGVTFNDLLSDGK